MSGLLRRIGDRVAEDLKIFFDDIRRFAAVVGANIIGENRGVIFRVCRAEAEADTPENLDRLVRFDLLLVSFRLFRVLLFDLFFNEPFPSFLAGEGTQIDLFLANDGDRGEFDRFGQIFRKSFAIARFQIIQCELDLSLFALNQQIRRRPAQHLDIVVAFAASGYEVVAVRG